jgi:hypothetical protein
MVNELQDWSLLADEVARYVRALVAGVKSNPQLSLKEVIFRDWLLVWRNEQYNLIFLSQNNLNAHHTMKDAAML